MREHCYIKVKPFFRKEETAKLVMKLIETFRWLPLLSSKLNKLEKNWKTIIGQSDPTSVADPNPNS